MVPEVLLSLNVMRVCKLGQHNCYFIEEAQGLLSDWGNKIHRELFIKTDINELFKSFLKSLR